MNYPHLAEQCILQFLKLQPLTTLVVDGNGQRNIYKASDSPDGGYEGSMTTKHLPLCLVECTGSEQYAAPSGNEKCNMRLRVQTHRDVEQDDKHRARCAEIFNLFRAPAIASTLSDFGGFTVEFLLITGGQSDVRSGRRLESSLEFSMFCAATDLGN